MDGIGPLFADDFTWRFTGMPEPLNKETLGGMVQAFKVAFPDMKHTLDTQITEGNTVVTPLTKDLMEEIESFLEEGGR